MDFIGRVSSYFLGALIVLAVCASASVAQESRTFDLNLVGVRVEGDPASIRVTEDDTVLIRWRADSETEIHLHGYDVKANLKPDAVTEMVFEAHATGRFPITAHGHHGDEEPVLIHVEVYPD